MTKNRLFLTHFWPFLGVLLARSPLTPILTQKGGFGVCLLLGEVLEGTPWNQGRPPKRVQNRPKIPVFGLFKTSIPEISQTPKMEI